MFSCVFPQAHTQTQRPQTHTHAHTHTHTHAHTHIDLPQPTDQTEAHGGHLGGGVIYITSKADRGRGRWGRSARRRGRRRPAQR